MFELKLRIDADAFEQIRADCRHYGPDEPPSPRLAMATEIVKAINAGHARVRIFSQIAGAEDKPECPAARTLRRVEEAKRAIEEVRLRVAGRAEGPAKG